MQKMRSDRGGRPCDPHRIVVGHRVSDGAPVGLVMLFSPQGRRSRTHSRPVISAEARAITEAALLQRITGSDRVEGAA